VLNYLIYKRLCRQLQQRQESCIGQLYDAYGGALYGVIFRIVGDEGAAVELLQDTFTKVWDKGHTYDPLQGRLYTWMMRIARNAALNHVQSKSVRNRKKIQGDDNLVYLDDQSRGANKMEACDLKGAVSGLETKYQQVIELIYYQGYTHQEVSDELDLPLGTVKSRIKIALRELKKVYEYGFSNALIMTSVMISLML